MRRLIRRSAAALFVLLMMFTLGMWQSSSTEAAANISWTTTNVILEKGKCTVKGYFKNDGDVGATVTNIKFVVDVMNKAGGMNIWSGVWDQVPTSCFVSAGSQRNWTFWYKHDSIPSYTSDNKLWNVQYHLNWD